MKFRIIKHCVSAAQGSGAIYYVEKEVNGIWGCSEAAFSVEDAECKLYKAIEKYKCQIQRIEVIKEIEV